MKRSVLLFLLFYCFVNSGFSQCATTITAFPYIENFESGPAGWASFGNHNDWVWCTPHKNVISTAGSGTKCWMVGDSVKNNNSFYGHTAGSSVYSYYERSWVTSPCFNFTNVQHPFISFLVFWDSEWKYDGANLQYSLNGGTTWTNVGAFHDPTDCLNANWYDTSKIKYLDSTAATVPHGWAGNTKANYNNANGVSCQGGHGSGGWKLAKHCMTYLAGKPSVKFRFAFGAGFTCNDYDGFAFDSVSIGEAPPNTADFTYTCTNSNTVSFSGITTECPSVYGWNFGDPTSGAANTASTLNATHTFSGPGTYNVTFVDSGPCNAAGVVTKTIHILGVTTTVVNAGCGSQGSATANVTGGGTPYTYSWSTTPTQSTITATNLNAGSYTVTVTAPNSCSATANAIITASGGITASITAQTNGTCSAAGSATVTPSGGSAPYNYTWSTSPAQSTSTATNLAAGAYTVTVKDASNCTTTASVTITQTSGITAAITASTNAGCGVSNGSATVTGNGGTGVGTYSYTWSTTPVQNTATATGLAAGTYSVTVKDGNNCSSTANVTITQPGGLSATTSSTNVTCFGGNNGSATATVNGGTAPITYSWNSTPVQNTPTAVNLPPGTYTLTLHDASACTYSTSVVILGPTQLTASITTHNDVKCFGQHDGNATAGAAGGTPPYTYTWNSAPVQTTQIASNLAAGIYVVTVSDGNNCTATAPVNIGQGTQFTLNPFFQGTGCASTNGKAWVTTNGGTGPFTYQWSNSQTTDTISNLSSGSYGVTVTDANLCTADATVNITQPSQIFISVYSSDASCVTADGKAWVTASGGTGTYTYQWSNNQTTDTIRNLTAGSYVVTVTDGNQCTSIDTAIVQQLGGITAIAATLHDATCFGYTDGSAVVTPNGGTLPYTYSWSTTPAQTNATAVNLGAGIYGVTVTDNLGCTAVANDTITSPPKLAFTATPSPVACFGLTNGSVSISSSSALTYSFNGAGYSADSIFNNLAGGSYSILAKDNNGCKDSISVTVIVPAKLEVAIVPDTVTIVKGQQVTLQSNVTGGTTPYTYQWQPSTDLSCNNCAAPVATPADTALYTVIVTDFAGCIDTATAHIIVTPLLTIVYPTAFTPNADGVNDKFRGIPTGEVSFYLLRVYNRWGDLLYETNNVKQGWDGTFNGTPQPMEVYTWYAQFRGLGSTQTHLAKGNVSLIR